MELVRTSFIGYHRRKICKGLIKIINRITAYLVIYSIIFLIIIFYPSQIGNREKQNQSKYVPKRERGILYAIKKSINGSIQRSVEIIYDKIYKMK